LARGGATAVAADVNVEAARQTVELITATGGAGQALALDVTDSADVRSVFGN
jgi:NAD(P)-dependent dehydrogenase (short-subunit alcohol dehydrogenase family)